MITRYQNTRDLSGPENEKKNEKKQADAVNDDGCRCKEIANMTPRQLLGLMINDLAFWKNIKKR
ncbi:MAG TPA: hypothetical protein VEI57_10170 [Nitrospirota bacterium]|nr:hypothetical protein [Nitrospirota bacterium]